MPPTSRPKRASNLRVRALVAVIALAAALPYASAMAGPESESDPPRPESRTERAAEEPATARGAKPDTLSGLLRRTGEPLTSPSASADGSLAGIGLSATSCGPELASPAGVKAQTCVLTKDDETWGRTYYRNTSGRELWGVLTLMRPDERTLQVRCELTASDKPGTCETPRQRTVHPVADEQPYAAVAEIADPDDGDRLLLRVGSNPPEGQED